MLIFTLILLVVIIIAVVYIFSVMPRVTDAADMDLQSTDYAYGGLSSTTVAANSLAAICAARDSGYGIALTVGLTKDRHIIISDSGIPLSRVLSLIEGRVPLMLELKDGNGKFSLCSRLSKLMDSYMGAFSVISADRDILVFFKKYRPRFARGAIIAKNSSFAHRHMLTSFISRPDFIVTHKRYIGEPAFLLATRLFKAKGFVHSINSEKQYTVCKKQYLFTVFENIHP